VWKKAMETWVLATMKEMGDKFDQIFWASL
jgi:hypothetical protein